MSIKKGFFELDLFPGKNVKLGLNRIIKELNGCQNLSIAGKVQVANKELIDMDICC